PSICVADRRAGYLRDTARRTASLRPFSRPTRSLSSKASCGHGTEGPSPCSSRAVEVQLRAMTRQLGDGDHHEAVRAAELAEIGSGALGAVLFDDLEEAPRGREAGRAGEVSRGLGRAPPLEHAARTRTHREDVPRTREVAGTAERVDRGADRVRAVVGGDA